MSSGGATTSTVAPSSTSNDNWTIDQSNNPLDDTKTVVISNSATSGTTQHGGPVTLIIRCKSGQLDAYLIWGYFLGRDNVDTSIRIGSAPVSNESWSLSSDSTSAFSPDPKSLIKSLIGADRLIAQVVPYENDPVIATFSTSGLGSAVVPLAQDCGLKL